MIRDTDRALLADDNEFQVRAAFFADLDPAARLKIIEARRSVIDAEIAHLASLRPETAAASDWGLRVLTFSLDRFRHERAWLDALQAAAGSDGDRDQR
jgi:hypothetical protein